MKHAGLLKSFPFPHVDLDSIGPPSSGLFLDVPRDCPRNFARGLDCRTHYEAVAARLPASEAVQCPFGFATIAAVVGDGRVAVTGFVPFPRLGGGDEHQLSKRYPKHHLDSRAAKVALEALAQGISRLDEVEKEVVRRQSLALHEMRKLNRTVKQNAERLCLAEAPDNPELASRELVQIWKTADLMSHQFDAIELLANERLMTLPRNSTIELYKLVDKCVRIFRAPDMPVRLRLSAPPSYSPRVRACDKTLHMVPTALIENALKYSVRNTEVLVAVRPEGSKCILEVSNVARTNPALTERLFERGVRASADVDGSGNGLYIARLVAQQHQSDVTLRVETLDPEKVRCTFSLALETV